jgi:5-methylcytosine-specific restriction endonuclease McrA
VAKQTTYTYIPRPKTLKRCEADGCGAEYYTHCSHSRFCTEKCQRKNEIRTRRISQVFKCKGCGEDFYPKLRDRTTYCTRECAFAHAGRIKELRAFLKSLRQPQPPSRAKLNRILKVYKPKPKPDRYLSCAGCGKPLFVPSGKRKRLCAPCAEERHRECKARSRHKDPMRKKSHKARCIAAGTSYENIHRRVVFERDGYKCQICGCNTPRRYVGTNHHRAPTLDCILAISNGGSYTYDNVQCACRQCNSHKSNKYTYGQMNLFPNPKQYQRVGGRGRKK